jgi:DNA-binding MarR family transcriptional regulator/GNAT superfamily N-acetyltransferase
MNGQSAIDLEAVHTVRRFNRFYTRQIGLLDEGLLKSEFPLTEVRLLYELAHRDGLTAADLCHELDLDAGYLSRILKKFEARGLVSRETSKADARQAVLSLTEAGRAAFEPLNRASQHQVAVLLERLTDSETLDLLQAMRTIEHALGERAKSPVPYLLRPHHVGDIGWIVHRQGVLYNQEYGWDETFEALVAEIAAGFVKTYDPRRERCWIAERDGRIAGSVFLIRESGAIAHLRLLYVEPEARRLGIGRRLVDECIRFAREKGYETVTLWTNDVLVSARRIYQAAGFKLVSEERHHSFSKDLLGQNWDLDL